MKKAFDNQKKQILILEADQLYEVVKDEEFANEAMQAAEKKINFKKSKKYK